MDATSRRAGNVSLCLYFEGKFVLPQHKAFMGFGTAEIKHKNGEFLLNSPKYPRAALPLLHKHSHGFGGQINVKSVFSQGITITSEVKYHEEPIKVSLRCKRKAAKNMSTNKTTGSGCTP